MGVYGRRNFCDTKFHNKFAENHIFLQFEDKTTPDWHLSRENVTAIGDLWDDFVHNAKELWYQARFLQ